MYCHKSNKNNNNILYDILYKLIFLCLNFEEKIIFKHVCTKFYQCNIEDLYNIDIFYTKQLTNDILKKYQHTTQLYLENIHFVTNINYLSKLKILNIHNNNIINTLAHMTTLNELDISGYYCNIGDPEIKNLCLIELNASENKNIKNLITMTTLKKLNISFGCGVDEFGIKDLNLDELIAQENNKITSLNFMTSLKKLTLWVIVRLMIMVLRILN